MSPRMVRRKAFGDEKLDWLQRDLIDERSRRVVFVSHCLLNENVRYLGGAGHPGGANRLIRRLQDDGVGIYQMPCPEQRAWGGVLKRYLLPMYNSTRSLRYRLRRPLAMMFIWYTRLAYARLARRVIRDVADYIRSGYEVVGIVGVGASPSCGVLTTLDVGSSLEVIARCRPGSTDAKGLNAALIESTLTSGPGLFVEALRRGLLRRRLEVPFLEHDLVAELREASLA